jgi:hypothetical protein
VTTISSSAAKVRRASSIAFTGAESPTRDSMSSVECGVRQLVGTLRCVAAGVVLVVRQPVEPGDVGGGRNDEHLCILARMRTTRPA